jgi:hypothetical protein
VFVEHPFQLLTEQFSSLLRERVDNGEIKVHAAQWPTFMYSFTDGYDPDDMQNGLCRGLLLVHVRSLFLIMLIISVTPQVFCHIFTRPSSALRKSTRAMKSPKAAIHGLTAVTGRTIAYAAVQVRPSSYLYLVLIDATNVF